MSRTGKKKFSLCRGYPPSPLPVIRFFISFIFVTFFLFFSFPSFKRTSYDIFELFYRRLVFGWKKKKDSRLSGIKKHRRGGTEFLFNPPRIKYLTKLLLILNLRNFPVNIVSWNTYLWDYNGGGVCDFSVFPCLFLKIFHTIKWVNILKSFFLVFVLPSKTFLFPFCWEGSKRK